MLILALILAVLGFSFALGALIARPSFAATLQACEAYDAAYESGVEWSALLSELDAAPSAPLAIPCELAAAAKEAFAIALDMLAPDAALLGAFASVDVDAYRKATRSHVRAIAKAFAADRDAVDAAIGVCIVA